MTPSLPCACSDYLYLAFVADQIVEPCEHLKPKTEPEPRWKIPST